ncbi:hypothetical protein [Spirosoma koreense]
MKMTKQPIDYRDLLKRYMWQVCEVQGLSFIDHCSTGQQYPAVPKFTPEEIAELVSIENELFRGWRP